MLFQVQIFKRPHPTSDSEILTPNPTLSIELVAHTDRSIHYY